MVSEEYTSSLVRGKTKPHGKERIQVWERQGNIWGYDQATEVSFLIASSLQVDGEMYSAALVRIYQTKRRQTSEDSKPHSHLHDILERASRSALTEYTMKSQI